MDGEGTQRLRKNLNIGSIYNIVQQLHEDWHPFKINRLLSYTRRLDLIICTLKDKSTSVLQFDFSENAAIVKQD